MYKFDDLMLDVEHLESVSTTLTYDSSLDSSSPEVIWARVDFVETISV